MEQNENTLAWMEEMREWQKENIEQRAVLCIAVDKMRSLNALFGYSLPIISALFAAMSENSEFANICKSAIAAKENPIGGIGLAHALTEFGKEHGIVVEDAEKTDDSSIKKSLKDLLSKLAEKL
ncbi:MAG: hypothetical protein U0L43_03075 [Muribaculaceae bacterium]|nr:hypothetical protein [Muribaculaceae bacterium]